MRAARWPAFFALSKPTQPTGTPGGIWVMERMASMPPAALRRLESGTPMTGRSVWAAATPGSAAEARAGDDDPQPAQARVLAVVGDGVGLAVRAHDARLVADARLAQDLGRALHGVHVGLRAHDDPDDRLVDLQRLEGGLDLDLRLGGLHLAHRTPAAMSRRSCLPGKSITSAAAYAALRAPSGSEPRAVTFSTRPPAVTTPPCASRAVPAWVTSTPVPTSSSPEIGSPFEDKAG